MVLQNETDINEIRELLYYEMRQKFIRKLQIVTGLLQNVTAIIKCEFYYKIIAKCVSTK